MPDRRINSRAIDVVMAHPDDMPTLSDREYSAYRKRYWQHKLDQADEFVAFAKAKAFTDDYVPLVHVLGREGNGIWV